MKTRLLWAIGLAGATSLWAESRFQDFVRVQGDQLVEEGKPFRFVSWNIPNLHLVEDYVPFEPGGRNEAFGWRWPNRFEITDALSSVRQMDGQVVRTYVLSVQRTEDPPEMPRHVLGPGKFNEEAFRTLDLVLQVANEQGVRLIIPFVDNWHWWGGRAQYAGFRGKNPDAFWKDPEIIADFKQTIRYLITRTNTFTGVRYADDKAILCWETGNELQSPAGWTREIAAYIKSWDRNHPVMDGYHTTELREESLSMPEVDIVTTHHYPGGKRSFAQTIRENAARAKGRKPYVVGEFGFLKTQEMAEAIQAVRETQTAGALAWSLRYRCREGGYYWHSEPAGGNKYKAFHWPGSQLDQDYDEIGFMDLMRREAAGIRGLTLSAVPAPAAPHLLPITDVSAISWQGSVGASTYVVERAALAEGPWAIVEKAVDEGAVQYRPVFSDAAAPQGSWFYRVHAANEGGVSTPSNVTGPVPVRETTLVDELADFSKWYGQSGTLEIQSRDCRSAVEDAHRASGSAGGSLVYHVNSPIAKIRIYAFFPQELADLRFWCSANASEYRLSRAQRRDIPEVTGDYKYWRRAVYELKEVGAQDRFVKIEFTGEAQIGRVEIRHAAATP